MQVKSCLWIGFLFACFAPIGFSAPIPKAKSTPTIRLENVKHLKPVQFAIQNVSRLREGWEPNELVVTPFNQEIQVFDIETMKPLRVLGGEKKKWIDCVLDPKKTFIAYTENSKSFYIEDLKNQKTTKIVTNNSQPSLAVSPDGSMIASGGYGTEAHLWDTKTGNLIRSFHTGKTEGGLKTLFSPDGKLLVVGNRNSETCIFDVETGKELQRVKKSSTHGLAFHPQGHQLVIGYVDGTISSWDVKEGKLLRSIKTTAKEIYTVDWSPDGSLIAASGLQTNIMFFDPKDLSLVKDFEAPEWVISVKFSKDGTRFYTGGGSSISSGERKVTVWKIQE
jgi:WD40 repeat protein